jgi:hypothetical protein
MPIGEADRNSSRPFVIAGPRGVWLAWKEFDGEQTTVDAMISHDGYRNLPDRLDGPTNVHVVCLQYHFSTSH